MGGAGSFPLRSSLRADRPRAENEPRERITRKTRDAEDSENDSEDDTLSSLQSWAASRANVTVLSETNVLVNVSRREGGSAKAARTLSDSSDSVVREISDRCRKDAARGTISTSWRGTIGGVAGRRTGVDDRHQVVTARY